MPAAIRIRRLGLCDYQPTLAAMRDFVDAASPRTGEEIWLLQHPPVYTLGRNGSRAHLLRATSIPLVHSDRGGQITYHAPGQLIAYLLLNIRARRLAPRRFVQLLQRATADFLAAYGIHAEGNPAAPGVYVRGAKIAALGLRLRRGWCYHGISLNISLDLAPFANINPCGHRRLPVTQLADHCQPAPALAALQTPFANTLIRHLASAETENSP